MEKQITISRKEINVLRETLRRAEEILNRFGMDGSEKPPKPEPRQTKTQRINKYKELITTGKRVKKPDHLKK